MTSYPPQTNYPPNYYRPAESNGLGIAGFVVSLAGIVVCGGFLCPIGLILSLVGLGKEPRGFAIAGTILGLLGTAIAAFVVMMAVGVIGAGWNFAQMFNGYAMTYNNMYTASNEIDQYYSNNNNTLPDEPTGTQLVSTYSDEWGTPIQYHPSSNQGGDYELVSAGPDMQFGTNDDISNTFWVFIATPQQATEIPAEEEDPSDAVTDFAFNQAAAQLSASFSVGSEMPGEELGANAIAAMRDAWNRPFKYSPTPNPPIYHLKSAGKDGVWNNEDDITKSFYFEPTGGQ